jgi:glycosyltransferase involved in cell wall biosynthesis
MYFAPSDVLIPRVDRQCTMSFCEAAADIGWDVELVSLNVRVEFDEPTRNRDIFDVYGVRRSFRLTAIPTGQRQSKERGRLLALWRAVSYPALAAWRLVAQRGAYRHDQVILYCRNYMAALGLLMVRRMLGRRALLLFEVHLPPERRPARLVLSGADGVLALSSVLGRELTKRFGVEKERIATVHQGTNVELVDSRRISKAEARSRLGLPQDTRLVVYTGKVYSGYREITYLIEAAKLLDQRAEMVIVGGRSDHVEMLREQVRSAGIANVRFEGFVPPTEVYDYQFAADVLVTYYPGDSPLNRYRSPGKVFEYMAARRPIVAADYESLHELLRETAAVFVERDRPDLLASAIARVLDDPGLAEQVARESYEDVQSFTWRRRAERVRDLVSQLTDS